MFDCIILKISSSKDLKDARNMVEKKGLIACEQKYQLKKCILSIFFNKLPLEIKPKTDRINEKNSTINLFIILNFNYFKLSCQSIYKYTTDRFKS